MFVKEPGSEVYVFPHKEDPDDYGAEAALTHCASSCSADLPLGDYSVRVVSADGVRSYSELALRTPRWISVAPAHQVVRDLGFAMGSVGTASTILGVALLAKAICDTNCTATARDTGGAIALGIGIPLMAIGWSLYVVHRKASIQEQILTQSAQRWTVQPTFSELARGGAVGAMVRF
jgi:hypothetical protein